MLNVTETMRTKTDIVCTLTKKFSSVLHSHMERIPRGEKTTYFLDTISLRKSKYRPLKLNFFHV